VPPSDDIGGRPTADAHSPIKAFWRKYPIPFALMVCFAFMLGGVAALLLSTAQKQTSSASQSKQQEAETYLRDMNEAQRAFYSQNNRFATSLEELERSANVFFKAYYYTYKLEATDKQHAKITAVPKEQGLKSYVGAVFAQTTQVTNVICQTQQPTEMMLPLPVLTDDQPQCPEGTVILPTITPVQ
jgi:type II secretory pathway pseudopilin PulG